MNRLQWIVKRWLLNLRWPGWAGLALAAFALAFYGAAVHPGKARLRNLDDEAAQLARQTGGRMAAAPVTSRSQLSNFYAFFPLTEEVPGLLSQLQDAATAHDLLLEKGEYRLIREKGFRVARYQATLPVRGSYRDVRGFVNDVLDSVPSVALEELTLKRESVDERELEAKVRFTLFLGVE
jgi:Tfp pilus assembly protein PilO